VHRAAADDGADDADLLDPVGLGVVRAAAGITQSASFPATIEALRSSCKGDLAADRRGCTRIEQQQELELERR